MNTLTVKDIIEGCQCTVATIVGEDVVIRCVTCPIHGDPEFRTEANGK